MSYASADLQSVYSTAPADWANLWAAGSYPSAKKQSLYSSAVADWANSWAAGSFPSAEKLTGQLFVLVTSYHLSSEIIIIIIIKQIKIYQNSAMNNPLVIDMALNIQICYFHTCILSAKNTSLERLWI